ncbi:MAG: dTDP-4-dehydrorhamnose reductase [Chloroflexi bacterium]|nr:dTDP-4-dehydrorhamnose reductase [Chloroflexota bacterium]
MARVAVIGAAGQLGRHIPAGVSLTHAELDLASAESVHGALNAAHPEGVILTAAYTNVDGCETHRDHAFAVNGEGPRHVARWCATNGAWLLFVSTNCVFDGAASDPYREDAPPHPISVYGASKLAGEEAVRAELERHFIVRTSWLYGPGGANFVTKMLALARSQPQMIGVIDEVASPTYAPDLAQALVRLAQTESFGTYHLTNDGACSRMEWLQAILRLSNIERPVGPVHLADFERPSRPPAYSALANTRAGALGITLRSWQLALQDYLALVPA